RWKRPSNRCLNKPWSFGSRTGLENELSADRGGPCHARQRTQRTTNDYTAMKNIQGDLDAFTYLCSAIDMRRCLRIRAIQPSPRHSIFESSISINPNGL